MHILHGEHSFSGHSTGDGISLSADGVTWYRVKNLDYDLNFNFTAKEVSLDTTVMLAGISYTSDFQIKFQQYDDTWYPYDGRMFDNVVVSDSSVTHYHPADADSNYVISMLEILGYIDEWAVGNVSMLEVLEGIDLWAAGHYYWDESEQKFKPGVKP